MPTYIFNKKQFINWMSEGLEDGDVIVFSDEATQMTASKKGMKFNFNVSSDAMNEPGDIGKFHFGDARAFAILKMKEANLNEKGLQIIELQKQKSYGR